MKTFTIAQFRERFPNDEACLNEIFRIKYSHCTECSNCKKPFDYTRVTTISKKDKAQRKSFQCKHCGFQVYPLAGTIYQKTRTPLTFWFYAIYLMQSTRNGLAAKEIERQLGVTYKCAFRMGHQIRKLMKQDSSTILSGMVAIDEVRLGGAIANKHKHVREKLRTEGMIDKHKIKILGMAEDKGKVYAVVIDKISPDVITPLIVKHVQNNSIIVTDMEASYKFIYKKGYSHVRLDHDMKQFKWSVFHGNQIEGFWAQLRRTCTGTHIKVSRKYIQNYVDECCFRYEHRKAPHTMFDTMVRRLA